MRIFYSDAKINQIFSRIKFKTKSGLRKTLNESALVIKQQLKAELRSKKSGAIKKYQSQRRRYSASPQLRSRAGESLARDTGQSEKKIKSNINGSKLTVGFLNFGNEFNYVSYWEKEVGESKKRPTLLIAKNKSLSKIQEIYRKNLKSEL